MGPLSSQESSLVISFINIGGLIGNFVAGPISQMIGNIDLLHNISNLLNSNSLSCFFTQVLREPFIYLVFRLL